MQVRIVMELTDDGGEEIGREIIADMTKITTGAEDLGLSLAEGKALLGALSSNGTENSLKRPRWAFRHSGTALAPAIQLLDR